MNQRLATLFTSKFVGALLHSTGFSHWLMAKQMSAKFIRRKFSMNQRESDATAEPKFSAEKLKRKIGKPVGLPSEMRKRS